MNAIRSGLLYAWMTVTGIPWAIAALLLSIFVRGPWLYRFCWGWVALSVQGGRVIMGIRPRVSGQQNVPDSPAVFLTKHQSAWETVVLPTLVSQPMAFVLKREVLLIPFLGWTLARLDMIQINRERRTAAYARLLRQGKKFLAQGTCVVMFPEGTRMPRGQRGAYQSGGARLAIGAGVPVVPVAVASARCWPKGWVKRPGVVDISFGPPIASGGKRPEALMREAADWIEAEMRRIDPLAYPADEAAQEAEAEATAPAPKPEPGAR